MARREQIIQHFVREYVDETGDEAVDRHRYANWLMTRKDVRPPPAPTELDLMARAVRRALKNEMRHDAEMVFVFVDTDKATREEMEKSIVLRVGGMVDDGVRLTYDIEHWNRVNPSEAPLDVQPNLDLRDQVEWRRNADIELPGDVELDGVDLEGLPGEAFGQDQGGSDDDAGDEGAGNGEGKGAPRSPPPF
jgi:hypothetical protein